MVAYHNTLPVFFKNALDFRAWLSENHDTEKEIKVGFYKVDSGLQNMTWSESVDQALCFGWIDGVRHAIDEERYCIRFTPRNPKSMWSAINIKKVENLTRQGLMHESGLALFNQRKEEKSRVYSFEKQNVSLDSHLVELFQKNPPAWEYFLTLAPSYRKTSIHWIMSAKQETTRLKRLHLIIQASTEQKNPWKK